MIIESSGRTDVGKKRESNEDSYLCNVTSGYFVVADGMGGHQAGEVASRVVVEEIDAQLQRFMSMQTAPGMTDDTLSRPANGLLSAILAANRKVFDLAQANEKHRGMGSTVSCVLFSGTTIVSANVGDSPVYLVRKETISPLSVPHTVEAELSALDQNRLTRIDAKYHHMLTRAMGIEARVQPDFSEVQSFPGDIVIVCSDGLSNKVQPSEMVDIVTQNSADDACRLFIGLANGRGGEDNITVIVAKLVEPESKRGRFFSFFSRFFRK